LTRILIVDDDPSIRFIERLILEHEGFEVLEAAHGQAALDLLRTDPLPDLVVTDLMMPVLTGMELIKRLREAPRTAALPIVVVSGNPEHARTFRAAGLVSAIINKPFDAVQLTKGVRAVISNTGMNNPWGVAREEA
jgi:CheY-like chemotaxis protein